jgi:prepilin-type N-terminal cleavage/methylation domain-containing protein
MTARTSGVIVAPPAARARRGISLVEVMIALVILSGIVLGMGMSTTNFSRKITDSDVRNRAQSVADMQVGRARAWPTYSTLSQLSAARFNGTVDGLISATTVVTDTTRGMNITNVTVTVSAVQSTLLPTPIKRTITIAAP